MRASDIGAYTFCRRAWWLAQVQGAPHAQPEVLARGQAAHAQHGRRVRRVTRVQKLALWCIGLGLAGLGLALAIGLLG